MEGKEIVMWALAAAIVAVAAVVCIFIGTARVVKVGLAGAQVTAIA